MDAEHIIRMAVEEGFAAAQVISTDEIVFDDTFQTYCAENLCGQYGINYSCPPACGTPAEMRQRILSHKKALVLQTIWEIDDLTNGPVIRQAKGGHNAAALQLVKRLRSEGCHGLLVGASGCALCSPCAMGQGKPCRFPELQYSCMSAYCVFVKKLADKCGIEYDCGKGLLAFFGMYVYD